MCFSLVSACLSVWGWIPGALSCYSPTPPPCPTLETEAGIGTVLKFGGSWQAGLLHSGSRVQYVCVRVWMYVHGEPVCKYVQRETVAVTGTGAGGAA